MAKVYKVEMYIVDYNDEFGGNVDNLKDELTEMGHDFWVDLQVANIKESEEFEFHDDLKINKEDSTIEDFAEYIKEDMSKRVFLYVTGGDYSAMLFEQEFDVQKFYEEMVEEGVKVKSVDKDGLYADIEILEFKEIDDKFISFIRDYIMDYDHSKDKDFFEVKAV